MHVHVSVACIQKGGATLRWDEVYGVAGFVGGPEGSSDPSCPYACPHPAPPSSTISALLAYLFPLFILLSFPQQELSPRFIPLEGDLQQWLDTPAESIPPELVRPPKDPDTGITQRRLSNGLRINYR
jgi:hypothetical protein